MWGQWGQILTLSINLGGRLGRSSWERKFEKLLGWREQNLKLVITLGGLAGEEQSLSIDWGEAVVRNSCE